MHRRPLLAVAIVASAICSSVPLLTGMASAEDGPDRRGLFLIATDPNGDGTHGVYRGDGHTFIADSPTTDVYALTGSRDGRRVAYLQDVLDASGDVIRTRAVVRDTTYIGAPLFSRTVSETTNPDLLDVEPSLSPAGSTLVWTQVDISGARPLFRTMRVSSASGTPAQIATGVYGAAFLNADALIGVTATGVVTLPTNGGSHPVAGLTADDSEFAVSVDGSRLAWTRETDAGAEIHVADLTVDQGVATVTGDRVVSGDRQAYGPMWGRDNSFVGFIDYSTLDVGRYCSAPSDGTGGVSCRGVPDTQGDVAAAVVTEDAVAPGAVELLPIEVSGSSARIRWTAGSGDDFYGVELIRSSSAGEHKRVRVAGTSYADTGLKPKTTYTYSVQPIDRAGNTGPWVSHQLTTLAVAAFPDPTSTRYYLNPTFRVTLPTGEYTVQYRVNGSGPLITWLSHATGTSQVFNAAKAGSSYGFLLTHYETDGSATLFALGTAVVPYDQTRATYSGSYVTQTLNERYLGSATILRTAGSAARLVVNGNRLQVIGEKCTSCGVMDVYVDGVRVAGIDTHDTQRRSRAVLYTRNLKAGVNHTVVIKARGTAGHPNVVLDGFGVRH